MAENNIPTVAIGMEKEDLKDTLETLIEMRQSTVMTRDSCDADIKAYSSKIGEVLEELGVRKVTGLPWTPTWTPSGFTERLDKKLLLNYISVEDLARCNKQVKRAGFLSVRSSE